MSTSENSHDSASPDTQLSVEIPEPTQVPLLSDQSGKREQNEIFEKAKALAQLSTAELHHYSQERLMEYMNAHIELVREERDDAEEERDRLRGHEVGKWFQALGGALMTTGIVMTRWPNQVSIGAGVIGCGVIVHVLALAVPYFVNWQRQKAAGG